MPAIPRRTAHRLVLAITLTLFAVPALADWPTTGTSGHPVCVHPAQQESPAICPDGSGGVYIAWFDARTPAGVYGQHLDPLGQPLWPANGIRLANGTGGLLAISPDGAGGLIVFSYASSNVFAQRIGAAGNALWGAGVTICNATGEQRPSRVFPDGAGGAVFAWHDSRSGTFSIRLFGQRVDASGAVQWAANGVPADLTPQNISDHAVASDGTGTLFLSWDLGTSVYVQKIDAGGNRVWGDEGIQVGSGPSWFHHSSIVTDGAGGAMVEWWDARSGAGSDLYAKRYDTGGAELWSPSTGAPVIVQPGEQRWSSMVADGAGGAIVAWLDFRSGHPNNYVYAQRLSPSGAQLWNPAGVPLTVTPSVEHYYQPVAMTRDGLGGAVIAWADYRAGASQSDIRITRVSAGGTTPWGPDGVGVCSDPGFQYLPVVASDDAGSAVVAWMDYRSGSHFDIYASRVDASGAIGPPVPTATQVSLVSAEAAPDRVRLVWFAASSEAFAATVERCEGGGGWGPLVAIRADATGRLTCEDAAVAPGGRYGYRLRLTEQGSSWTTSEQWVDVPGAATFALEGVRPSPVVGAPRVAFRLPDSAPATLELFDVRGRRVARHDVGERGAGRHEVVIADPALAPGVYLLRLTRAASVRTARVVMVER